MRSTAEPGVGTHPKPLRRIEAALSQLGCVAANEDAQANVFPLLPVRIAGAGSCSASPRLWWWWDAMPQVPLRFTWGYSWCHASGVGCLRRNYVKPALAHKNFARAGLSGKAATLQIFRAFRAFRGQKNRLWAASPRQVFSCLSLLKNLNGWSLSMHFELLLVCRSWRGVG